MEMDKVRVIAVNPGSTSTKIAVFQNDKAVFLKTIKHTSEELAPYPKITDQFEYRKPYPPAAFRSRALTDAGQSGCRQRRRFKTYSIGNI